MTALDVPAPAARPAAAAVAPPAAALAAAPLLQTVGLTKHYPGVRALDGVDFELARGEVHVLFGENGAGKSTLISLLAGVHAPTAGEIRLDGRAVRLHGVREARRLGIGAVFQEFSLVPQLTVAQNLFLGDEPRRHGLLDAAAIEARARALLAELDFELDPRRAAGTLTRAEQQMVEIAKGLHGELRVLILDEPTASLTEREAERLFAVVARLRARGVGIVYISHRMQEIGRIADRITVLRDGRKVATVAAREATEASLIEMMTGRSIDQVYPAIRRAAGETVLEVQGLRTAGVADASFTVRRGEVLGIAGLVGSGKSELLRAVFGAQPLAAGRVRFLGHDMAGASPARMLAAGMYYLPPDRKEEGLVLEASSARNITLPAARTLRAGALRLLSRRRQAALAQRAAEQVELAARNLHRAVGLLSGGNQQKALFAKGLARPAQLYVFDEPTVGVDVGTRAALYRLIQQLTESGAAVVVISSDLPEVLHLAHRVLVMRRGQIAGELEGDAICEREVLARFFDRDAPPAGGAPAAASSQTLHGCPT